MFAHLYVYVSMIRADKRATHPKKREKERARQRTKKAFFGIVWTMKEKNMSVALF